MALCYVFGLTIIGFYVFFVVFPVFFLDNCFLLLFCRTQGWWLEFDPAKANYLSGQGRGPHGGNSIPKAMLGWIVFLKIKNGVFFFTGCFFCVCACVFLLDDLFQVVFRIKAQSRFWWVFLQDVILGVLSKHDLMVQSFIYQ